LSLFILFEVSEGHSNPWKGQIAGCKAPISREGVTVLSRSEWRTLILELAFSTWGWLVEKALTPINTSKLSFTSELVEVGLIGENRKSSFLVKSP